MTPHLVHQSFSKGRALTSRKIPLEVWRPYFEQEILRISCEKLQTKDYSLINAFQTNSCEKYFVTKSYQNTLFVQQEELSGSSTNKSQLQGYRSGK